MEIKQDFSSKAEKSSVHLYTFFCEVHGKIICRFKKWVIFYFIIDLELLLEIFCSPL